MTKTLGTYRPRWQERFASLSQLFKIHWALHAPREQRQVSSSPFTP